MLWLLWTGGTIVLGIHLTVSWIVYAESGSIPIGAFAGAAFVFVFVAGLDFDFPGAEHPVKRAGYISAMLTTLVFVVGLVGQAVVAGFDTGPGVPTWFLDVSIFIAVVLCVLLLVALDKVAQDARPGDGAASVLLSLSALGTTVGGALLLGRMLYDAVRRSPS